MQAIHSPQANASVSALQAARTAAAMWKPEEHAYTLRVLSSFDDRAELASLRRYAPMGVEDDLGAGLMPFETLRDEVGVVTTLYRDDKLVATMRFVPSGHKLTAAERLGSAVSALPAVQGDHNWEVGRLIVDPEERSPAQLQRCLALALRALIQRRKVEHFYAIATVTMARLWRRFGMLPTADLQGASGNKFLLVSGHVEEVAAALGVPLRHSTMPVGGQFC
jgi:predicted GNAT family N-acyltransferase